MSENPFKIIEPREQVPDAVRNDVLGSVKSVVLILRFVQLFVGDFSGVMLEKLSLTNKSKKNNSSNQS